MEELKQQDKQRQEQIKIDGIVYRILVEETTNARETPYDAICRLIQNNRERICCLEPDGGKKVC